MAMAPMGAGDVIFIRQVHAGTDSDGLFADIEMGETGHGTPGILIHYLLLKIPDLQHLLEHFKHQILWYFHPTSPSGSFFSGGNGQMTAKLTSLLSSPGGERDLRRKGYPAEFLELTFS